MVKNLKDFKSILNRNKFDLIEENEFLIIKKRQANRSDLQKYYLALVLVVIFGIIYVFFFSMLFGLIILFGIIPVYLRIKNLAGFEKLTNDLIINISNDHLVLHQGVEQQTYHYDSIDEIRYFVEKDKDLSVGMISFVYEGNEIQLIHIFDQDKRYVEDDAEKLADFFSELLS